MDDIVVKVQESEGLIFDLAEISYSLRKFSMKLNPEKCTFGVASGKLLGYMISHRGINPNPEKISAIMNMKPSKSIYDIQKLAGCMTTLIRFISRLGVRGLHFSSFSRRKINSNGPRKHKRYSKNSNGT
jgi:hypothetical protein